MLKFFDKFFEYICFILSPPFCFYCRKWLKERQIFCTDCDKLIKPVVSYRLAVTEKISATVLAISGYEGPIKGLILAKHSANRLASFYLGRLIYQKTALKSLDFDVIVPLPLHWTRKMKRGYNQVELMAQEISKMSNKPIVKAISRAKKTDFQSTLSKEARAQNVKDVFVLRESCDLYGKKILLIDDLMTTGSTLKSAIKVLNNGNPASLICVVGARVLS